MTIQYSVDVGNAILDAWESAIGTAPTLEIRSGAQPANCATADSGTLLASIALPSDWMTAASGGSKSLSGSWIDAAADATGTAGHYRIKQGGSCKEQGSITATGGGGDLTLNSVSISTGLQVQITTFTRTA